MNLFSALWGRKAEGRDLSSLSAGRAVIERLEQRQLLSCVAYDDATPASPHDRLGVVEFSIDDEGTIVISSCPSETVTQGDAAVYLLQVNNKSNTQVVQLSLIEQSANWDSDILVEWSTDGTTWASGSSFTFGVEGENLPSQSTVYLRLSTSTDVDVDTYTFRVQGERLNPADPSDNDISKSSTGTLIVEEASSVLEVGIDIRPDSINIGQNGVVSVVLYGSADFNVADVDLSTIQFLGASPVKANVTDNDGDGYNDLLLHFRVEDMRVALIQMYEGRGTYELSLIGQLFDGTNFQGSDEVTLLINDKVLAKLMAELGL